MKASVEAEAQKAICTYSTKEQIMNSSLQQRERLCGHILDLIEIVETRLLNQRLYEEEKVVLMDEMEYYIMKLLEIPFPDAPDIQGGIAEVVAKFETLVRTQLEVNHSYCSSLQDIRLRLLRRAREERNNQ